MGDVLACYSHIPGRYDTYWPIGGFKPSSAGTVMTEYIRDPNSVITLPADAPAHVVASGHFYQQRLTLIPAWISNYTHCNMCDEIIHPFLNLNGATVEVYKCISNFIPHFTGACDYLSMLGLKLNHVSKSGPRPSPSTLTTVTLVILFSVDLPKIIYNDISDHRWR